MYLAVIVSKSLTIKICFSCGILWVAEATRRKKRHFWTLQTGHIPPLQITASSPTRPRHKPPKPAGNPPINHALAYLVPSARERREFWRILVPAEMVGQNRREITRRIRCCLESVALEREKNWQSL